MRKSLLALIVVSFPAMAHAQPMIPPTEQTRAVVMLETVKRETGFGSNQEPLPFITEVVCRLKYPWGLNGKRGNVTDPSKDILAYDVPHEQPLLVDVLVDSGGKNQLTFNPLPWPQSAGAIFVVPVCGPPPPPPIDLETLKRQVQELHDHVVQLSADINALKSDNQALRGLLQGIAEAHETVTRDHNGRLRSIETSVYKGKATLLPGLRVPVTVERIPQQ